jgi:hypothetical protein
MVIVFLVSSSLGFDLASGTAYTPCDNSR